MNMTDNFDNHLHATNKFHLDTLERRDEFILLIYVFVLHAKMQKWQEIHIPHSPR